MKISHTRLTETLAQIVRWSVAGTFLLIVATPFFISAISSI